MAKYRVVDLYPEVTHLRYQVERYGFFGWQCVNHFASLVLAKAYIDNKVNPKVVYER